MGNIFCDEVQNVNENFDSPSYDRLQIFTRQANESTIMRIKKAKSECSTQENYQHFSQTFDNAKQYHEYCHSVL